MQDTNQISHNKSITNVIIDGLKLSLKFFFVILTIVIIVMTGYFLFIQGWFVVDKQKSVILLNFGKYVKTYTPGSGIHFALPEPMSQKIYVSSQNNLLEVPFLEKRAEKVPRPSLIPGYDSYVLTAGQDIVLMKWIINYNIYDPEKFFLKCYSNNDIETNKANTEKEAKNIDVKPLERLLTDLLKSSVVKITGSYEISHILYKNSEYRKDVAVHFDKMLEKMDIGVKLVNLNLDGQPKPPHALEKAFNEVLGSSNIHQSQITKAKEFANQIHQNSLARISRIKADALLYKTRIVESTISDSIKFNEINEQYKNYPNAMRLSLLTSVLRDVLDKIENKYIFSDNAGKDQQVRIRITPIRKKAKTK